MRRPGIDEPRGLWKQDGSFRDAYLLDTTLQEWDALFSVVRAEKHQFFVDALPSKLPQAAEVFRKAETSSVLLTIFLDRVAINCHFFSEQEIELDIDPAQIESSVEHDAVLAFLERLSASTQRAIRVTEESLPGLLLLEFDPTTSRWTVHEH